MYSSSSCSEASKESSSTDGWGNVKENRENQIHGVVEEKVKTPAKRIALRCPLKGRKSKVIHLPWHLRKVHKWTRERAKNTTSSFGVRKSFFPKPVQPEVSVQQKKDYHRHRPCPIAGCHSVVKRLPNHIQQVHKDIKSSLQTSFMTSALPQDLDPFECRFRQPRSGICSHAEQHRT